MSSTSLTPYKSNSTQETFILANESSTGAKWIVAGRSLSAPYSLELSRKLTAPSATGNDRVELRLTRVEPNATTGKLATASVILTVSIPKDTSVLVPGVQKEMLSVIASLLNEQTAMESTNVKITALIQGTNL